MARVPNKHNRDQNLNFQGFLNNLEGWEHSLKEKDKKLKAQSPIISGSEAISRMLGDDEDSPDANSEKELGNEYFKQKKFKEAIDCYSRSIAFSPTAVAFANRAMAYLKIKRFEEAENDCTEALDLDDRYIKAYSRRATARKELGKLKESIEDTEFALRLEPQNQELKKQHAEAKDLYKKEVLKKASTAVRDSTLAAKKVGVTEVQTDHTEVRGKSSDIVNESKNRSMKAGNGSSGPEPDGSLEGATLSSGAKSFKRDQGLDSKREPKTSVLELASRAASRAMAEAAKNISPPKSAYQFEASWRAISGDRVLQANFLKAISPATLPQLFRNALSAPILIDIIKCIATFFVEETERAVEFLDNLTKVSRFDMIIMCLSAADRADLHQIWEEVFTNNTVSTEYVAILNKLRPKYCPGGWQMHVREESTSSSLIKEM